MSRSRLRFPARRGQRGLALAGAVLALVLCGGGATPARAAEGGEAADTATEATAPEAPATAVPVVFVARIDGSINPASSDYLQRVIRLAGESDAAAVLIQLDTPGGLLASTKDIIQAILNAPIPVLVYVSPHGAWAGSAGTFITLAGHVAAMAPGTSIGAAHPVGVGGGTRPAPEDEEAPRDFAAEKAENFTAAFIESIARERDRNVEWAVKAVRESVAIPADEAVRLDVVDLVAPDVGTLLEEADGREVSVAGRPWTIDVAGALLERVEMDWVTSFFDVLADPNIAVLLILAGLLGLYVELTTPGVVIPGVAGGICLVLGFVSLQILPFSWLGLLLLLGGVAFVIAELFVASFGLLFAAGVLCFLLGGSMLFDLPEQSDLDVDFWSVLVPAVVAVSLFGGVAVFAVGRAFRRAQSAGEGELVGHVARAVTALDPEGTVFVRGENWRARTATPVVAGERVEIVAVEGLLLRVRPAPPES